MTLGVSQLVQHKSLFFQIFNFSPFHFTINLKFELDISNFEKLNIYLFYNNPSVLCLLTFYCHIIWPYGFSQTYSAFLLFTRVDVSEVFDSGFHCQLQCYQSSMEWYSVYCQELLYSFLWLITICKNLAAGWNQRALALKGVSDIICFSTLHYTDGKTVPQKGKWPAQGCVAT